MEELLSSQEQAVLEKVCRQKTVAHRLVERSQVLLGYEELPNQSQLSVQLGQSRGFVIRWLNRWQQKRVQRMELAAAYQSGMMSSNKYEKELLSLLSDQPRSGSPVTFTSHQQQQLMAIACQTPADFALPFTHWTHQLLSEQAKRVGIVISSRHLGRLLKTSRATASPECVLVGAAD